MANLIIKPSTGSGNKLILQDQAGNPILTSGDTVAGASYGFGTSQVKQWRKKSTLVHASAGDVTMGAPFDGSATITPSVAGNFIRAEFGNTCDHGATWRSAYFLINWSSDNGSTWNGLAGGAMSSNNLSSANMYGDQVVIEGYFNPNTTNAVKVRIVQNGHTNGHPSRHGQYYNPGADNSTVGPWYASSTGSSHPAVGFWLILEEIAGGMCTTTDIA